VITVALIITLLTIITRENVAYSLVIVWALLGIYIKRTDITYGIQNDITLTVAVSAILIILTIIIELEWILLLENKNLNFYSFSSYPIGTT